MCFKTKAASLYQYPAFVEYEATSGSPCQILLAHVLVSINGSFDMPVGHVAPLNVHVRVRD